MFCYVDSFPVARPFVRAFATLTAIVQLTSAAATNNTILEDFSTAPLARGWETHGDSNLFHWNTTNQNLEATWDSSKTNSYFRLPIRPLTSEDDFAVALDLQMHDIQAGVNPERTQTFQFAFGFQNRADADGPAFIRGTGANTPNLAEFNFMPDTGFGPTVWPAMFPTNGLMNYSANTDFALFEIPIGIPMRITLGYTATNHTISLEIRTNGVLVGEVVRARLVDVERGFRLDAFSISSYSDEGQAPGPYQGSILARGTIDNVALTLPPSPIRFASGRLVSGRWEHEVTGEAGWLYVLEATADFDTWVEASAAVEGTGATMPLTPADPESATQRFFRVKAIRK